MAKVFVINGAPTAGKDTFIDMLQGITNTPKITRTSIIDPIKEIAYQVGWDGGKTPKDRKFLAELKTLVDTYSGYTMKRLHEVISNVSGDQLVFVCSREVNDIKRICNEFNAQTIYIKRDVAMQQVMSNHADQQALSAEITYDYIIENNGTLKDLHNVAESFMNDILGGN